MTQKLKLSMLDSSGTMPAWDGSALTGISSASELAAVKTNVAVNFFLDAVDSSRNIQNLADGFVDQFEDQAGVDDIRSTNEVYNTSGDYYGETNMTLVSEPSTALAVPTNAHVTLFKEDVDATTVNTDIMAWASRNKQTFTATNASNVLNATAHGLTDGDRVMLSSTGTTTLQEMTNFDGGTDWLNIAEGTLGATDGKSFTICFYIRMLADSTTARILSTTNGRFNINLSTNNAIYFLMRDSSNNTALNGNSAASLKVADGLTHVAISIDAANSTGHIRLNNDPAIALSVTNRTIDITQADFVIGDTTGGGGVKINADIGRFYLTQEYIDISNNTNLAKFIDADNNPVDMGANGSTPSGSQPLIFLNNTFGTFQNNLGSGGNFTENGTLTQGTNLTETDLPAGLSTSPIYHVVNKTADTFQVAATNGGSAVALTDDGTGTHSVSAITPVTLVDESTYDVYDIVSGTADISAQPSGTNMNLVVQTKNNKDVKIHGQSLQWS